MSILNPFVSGVSLFRLNASLVLQIIWGSLQSPQWSSQHCLLTWLPLNKAASWKSQSLYDEYGAWQPKDSTVSLALCARIYLDELEDILMSRGGKHLGLKLYFQKRIFRRRRRPSQKLFVIHHQERIIHHQFNFLNN